MHCVSALRAEKYSRAQVDLMQEQETKREREQAKVRRVVSELRCGRFRCSKAWPSLDACKGAAKTNAYGLAFPAELVGRIERYLVEERSSRSSFRARQMDASQLRLPPLQETITQVLECVKKFRQDWPEEAKKLGF